ncbi:MAG TPA: MgtC/SapB family protein [Methylomirabilota bacterium]|nr:MgtC/SapB family protein [Methylomirabilota bacterium]
MDVPYEDLDAVFRLLAACFCGMLIGANRGVRGKPTGMRTLGLVSLGAALVTVVMIRIPDMAENPDALSRVLQGVIQGVLTGIGFIGAGVVIRERRGLKVHGLTTAAAVWVTAALGIACALASWDLVAVAIVTTLLLLILVRPVDRWLEARNAGDDRGAAAGD